MQSIFFVNSNGKLIIPSRDLLVKTFEPIRRLPILFPSNWDATLVNGVCEMSVIEAMKRDNVKNSPKPGVIFCKSFGMWKKFLNADSVTVNAVALKCWRRDYQVNRKPSSSLVIIADEGELDQSGIGFDLSKMEMKNYPIAFVEAGVMQ